MKYNGGKNPLYYPFYRTSLTVPETFDDTLSYYESILRLNNALHELVDELNENWNEMAADRLDKWIGNYLNESVGYTPDDKGLHIIFSTSYASGDHIYDPDTQTMEIVRSDKDEQTFKI